MTGPARLTAVALAGLAVTAGALTTASAAAPTPSARPSLAHTLRQQLLAGTFARQHGLVSLCDVTIAGQRYHLGCGVSAATAGPTSATALTTDTPAGYGPADLSTAFHLPADPGSGSVSIIVFGFDPEIESDLAVYRQTYGLPACTTANGCLRIMDDTGGLALRPDIDPISVGFSEYFAHETVGQPAEVAADCGGSRAIADVSAVSYGLATYDTYYPIGISNLAGRQPGWNVLGGTAGPGWDGPTGVGVPDGLGAF